MASDTHRKVPSTPKSERAAWIAIVVSVIALLASVGQFVWHEQEENFRRHETEQVNLRNTLCDIERKLARSWDTYLHLQPYLTKDENGNLQGGIPSYSDNAKYRPRMRPTSW